MPLSSKVVDRDWPVLCADCLIDVMPMDTPAGTPDWHRYMVHDRVWREAGLDENDGWLCIQCLTTRVGRPLTGADFPRYPINQPGRDDDYPLLAELKLAAQSNPRLRFGVMRSARCTRGFTSWMVEAAR